MSIHEIALREVTQIEKDLEALGSIKLETKEEKQEAESIINKFGRRYRNIFLKESAFA